MEQSSEAAPTSSNGDVETVETIVIKKPAAVAVEATVEKVETTKEETVEKKEQEPEVETTEVVATIKIEKQASQAADDAETEEVIVEEVEESDQSITESEKEVTVEVKKPSSDAEKKIETVEANETQVSEPKKETPSVQSVAVKTDSVVVEDVEEEETTEEEEEEEEEVVEEKVEAKAKEPETSNDKNEKVSVEEAKPSSVNEKEVKVEGTEQVDGAKQSKQENVNNTIKEIISDIDCNIREQERIAHLKQEEYKLLQKQHELAQHIQEQQLLAQKLAAQNDLLQQQFQQKQYQQEEKQQQQYQPQQQYQELPKQPEWQQPKPQPQQKVQFKTESSSQQFAPPQTSVSRYSTYEETKDGNTITQKRESFETEESSNVTKRIDLQKIFTPATDAEEILPRNRKLYASSAFYTPGLHPTVEDQVELARRISHSLSDISNQQSKGQSMYSNRKKRSVKWVHEGSDYHPYQGHVPPKPPTSPSILPAYSDAGKHRVQLNLHQEHCIEKYARPGLKVVKSPWEAALESGSASTAFVDDAKAYRSITPTPSPAPLHEVVYSSNAYNNTQPPSDVHQSNVPIKYNKPSSFNDHQKDLAYKPNLAQGWKAPSVSLPKELYMPKEIPLESYAPPPQVNLKPSTTYSPTYQNQTQSEPHTWNPAYSPAPASISQSPYNDYSNSKPGPVDYHGSNFPLTHKTTPKPAYGGSGSNFPISTNIPPKQQYWEPTSYQKAQPLSSSQKVPHVNFNPSPLPYDKLAKFENSDNSNDYYQQPPRYLAPNHGYGSKVRNSSPAPFGGKSPVPSQYSPPLQQYSNLGSSSYTPSIPSSTPTYGHYNPNELLHGQTFNNSARGWKSSGGVNSIYPKQRAPLTTGCDMPYTDF